MPGTRTKMLTAGVGVLACAFFLTGGRVEWAQMSHAAPAFIERSTSAVPAQPSASAAVADIKSLSSAFSNLSEQVSPSVVNIYTTSGGNAQMQGMPQNLPPGFEEELQRFFGPGMMPFNQLPQMKREALRFVPGEA